MFSKNSYLIIFLTSFIFFILVNNFLQDFFLSFSILVFISIIYLSFILYKANIKKYLFLLIFIFFGAILWIFVSLLNLEKIKTNEDFLEKFFLRKQTFVFEIKEIYKKDDFSSIYISKIIEIDWKKINKNINWLIILWWNYNLKKWNLIQSNIQILKIQNYDNSFNYKNFLLSKNIYFKVNLYDFENLWSKTNFLTKLDEIRNKMLSTINELYPKEEWIFLAGILLWARENIPKELNDNLNNSWTTHFIAVSWFNITILIIFLWYIFKFIPVFVRSILIVWFLIIFCLFVWLEASVVRAGIMWILWYFVSISGRKSISINLVLLSAFFMLLYNPFFINYDVSFQLSFLAVLWILYTNNFFEWLLSFFPKLLWIKESLVLSLSAMSLTLPIMLFDFWQFSLLAPISNVLIAWTIPFAMLFWFLSIIFYFFVSLLWKIIWFLPFLLLKWDILVIDFFWNLDNFIIKSDFWNYTIYFKIIYFIIILFCIITLLQKSKKGS